MDAAGKVVLKPAPILFTFPAGADPAAAVEVQFKLSVPRAELWSIPRPYLYTLTVAVADASSGAINDEVTMPVGLRLGNFTERDGYELNGQRVRRTDVERFFCPSFCPSFFLLLLEEPWRHWVGASLATPSLPWWWWDGRYLLASSRGFALHSNAHSQHERRSDDAMRITSQVRIKGFCLHDNFAGVGVAVPDRINLFRAQSLRGIGGNSWRMSHNAGAQATLSILDVLGVLVSESIPVYKPHNKQRKRFFLTL